jgi:RimJ/RimL family protein N-acetyltransferase
LLRYQPTLRTTRLQLRPFVAEDAVPLHELAGAREVADTTIGIPHPYSLAAAKSWIAALSHFFRNGTAVHFAVELRETPTLIGAVSLRDIDSEHRQGELAFWIGTDWWKRGYATEAAWEAVRFGLEEMELNRVYAHALARSPASSKVLAALGMRQEGVLRQRIRKWGTFEDVSLYSILLEDATGK